MLEVRGLRAGYAGREIVHGISFSVRRGELACMLGPNGCGKTTTLKTLLGLLRPIGGSVLMGGADTTALRESQRARLFAYIPQAHTPPFPFTVHDVVLLGRTPHLGTSARPSAQDEAIVADSLDQMGIRHLAHIPYTQLSGGQQQLALIARALAQRPRMLLMDEPTASLDFGNQQLVMRRMAGLARGGMGVLMVTHDPDHALFCADRAIVMEEGRIVGDGPPHAVLDSACLRQIFDADIEVVDVSLPDGRRQRVAVPVFAPG